MQLQRMAIELLYVPMFFGEAAREEAREKLWHFDREAGQLYRKKQEEYDQKGLIPVTAAIRCVGVRDALMLFAEDLAGTERILLAREDHYSPGLLDNGDGTAIDITSFDSDALRRIRYGSGPASAVPWGKLTGFAPAGEQTA